MNKEKEIKQNTNEYEENEITIKVSTDLNNLINILKQNGFKKEHSFIVEDRYMLQTEKELEQENIKEILNESIRVRHLNFFEKNIKRSELIKKVKKYDKNENILKQKTINCVVLNKDDAFEFIKGLGYKEILNMTQRLTDYVKEKELITICEIDDKIYIEIEDKDDKGNIIYSKIEDMINVIKKYDIPHDESEYFAQKAIDKLNDINN